MYVPRSRPALPPTGKGKTGGWEIETIRRKNGRSSNMAVQLLCHANFVVIELDAPLAVKPVISPVAGRDRGLRLIADFAASSRASARKLRGWPAVPLAQVRTRAKSWRPACHLRRSRGAPAPSSQRGQVVCALPFARRTGRTAVVLAGENRYAGRRAIRPGRCGHTAALP